MAKLGLSFLYATITLAALLTTSIAQQSDSGLPLPRFVSVKFSNVHMRVGPGRNYTILWNYQKQGIPVEITQEYDNWRKIRDSDGTEGWVYQSLLSSKRTAIVAPWKKNKQEFIALRYKNSETSPLTAQVEANTIGAIQSCDGTWCELDFKETRGFIQQNQLWGVYPNERIK